MADEKEPAKSNEVGTWLSEIKRAQNTMRTWTERCERIRKKYRYEASTNARIRQYQMLWSNMETMKPSVYTKPPKGVVQQRWKDRDPVSRNACELLECDGPNLRGRWRHDSATRTANLGITDCHYKIMIQK